MYTVAKYDNTEGCTGGLAYYVFKGEHETLRSVGFAPASVGDFFEGAK
jgi:hypothetical protein